MEELMRRVLSLVILTVLVKLGPSLADTLTVAGSVTISTDTTFDYVVVKSTGELTANGAISVTGDMLVESNGRVTHSVRLLDGLRTGV